VPANVEADSRPCELGRTKSPTGGKFGVLSDADERTPDVDDEWTDWTRVLGLRLGNGEQQEQDYPSGDPEARAAETDHSWSIPASGLSKRWDCATNPLSVSFGFMSMMVRLEAIEGSAERVAGRPT